LPHPDPGRGLLKLKAQRHAAGTRRPRHRACALIPCSRDQGSFIAVPERYAKRGATRPSVVFRRWNTRKKSLRRNNLQSLDAMEFFPLTGIWHIRCR